MDNHDRELSKTEEWFREKLHDTVKYGLAALTMIGGWLMSNDSIISIQHADNAEKQEAAVILGIRLVCLAAESAQGIADGSPHHPDPAKPPLDRPWQPGFSGGALVRGG